MCIFPNVITLQIILRNEITGNKNSFKVASTQNKVWLIFSKKETLKFVLFWNSCSISISAFSAPTFDIQIQIRHCGTDEAIKNKVLSNILHKYIQMNYRLFSRLYLHLKNIFTLKGSSAFATILMEKPGNWFAIAKMWEKYLKKKEILRKGP